MEDRLPGGLSGSRVEIQRVAADVDWICTVHCGPRYFAPIENRVVDPSRHAQRDFSSVAGEALRRPTPCGDADLSRNLRGQPHPDAAAVDLLVLVAGLSCGMMEKSNPKRMF